MPEVAFAVEDAQAVEFAAVPTINFRLRVTESTGVVIENIALRCQIQIEAARRHYSVAEKQALADLFGEPDRWGQSLRMLLWTHANVTVRRFENSVTVEVPVACSFDFNVAATKYFHAAEHEDVALCFQFSGTTFFTGADGTLQIAQIGWDKEARYRLAARVWHQMMDHYYPDSTWLRVRRDVFERLYAYKRECGVATWEQALERLLPVDKEAAS